MKKYFITNDIGEALDLSRVVGRKVFEKNGDYAIEIKDTDKVGRIIKETKKEIDDIKKWGVVDE